MPSVYDEREEVSWNLSEGEQIRFKAKGAVGREHFAIENREDDFWKHIRTQLSLIIRPFTNVVALGYFGIIAFISIVLSFLWKLNEPLVRGWRLQVVKNVALKKPQLIPSPRPDLLLKYYWKGLVLIFSRTVYFLPLVIVVFLSGAKMLGIAKEVAFFLWDKAMNSDDLGIGAFFIKKVLPQFGVEVIIQLVVLALYVILVWPIYRIIMVSYALGKSRGWSFFSMTQIKKAIAIFKNHSALIYGVYGFVLSVDVFVTWFSWTVGWVFFFIMPLFVLFARHWVKGYAYGILGRKLIALSVFEQNESTYQNILDENV